VLTVAFSPDRLTLASGGTDSMIRLWDTAALRETRSFPVRSKKADSPEDNPNTPAFVTSLCFAPGGGTLASADYAGNVRIWNPVTGELILDKERAHTNSAWRVTYSPDGRILASAGEDGAIVLWNPSSGEKRFRLSGDCFAFAFDGSSFAHTKGRSVHIIDLETRRSLLNFTGMDWVTGLSFSPDRRTLTSTTNYGIQAWDLSRAGAGITLAGHGREVTAVAVSPQGIVASSDEDGHLHLWNASGGHIEELTASGSSDDELISRPTAGSSSPRLMTTRSSGRSESGTSPRGGASPISSSKPHLLSKAPSSATSSTGWRFRATAGSWPRQTARASSVSGIRRPGVGSSSRSPSGASSHTTSTRRARRSSPWIDRAR
jgi:WD40 repeat protein